MKKMIISMLVLAMMLCVVPLGGCGDKKKIRTEETRTEVQTRTIVE